MRRFLDRLYLVSAVFAALCLAAIAVVMLFVTGYAFGRVTQYHPWGTGFAMVVLGLLLVALTMALGG